VAFSASVEDYVKAIYSLTRGDAEAAATSDLAERLGITPGSVSAMVRRMSASGLAEHVPYHGVRLTPEGMLLALRVIRRHRLLELFLATSLDIPWENVHQYADALEHAASDELVELIADKLGDPVFDPHGDPIPDRNLEIAGDVETAASLAELDPGMFATIVRVSDSDPAMLRYLTEHGIGISDEVEMVGRQPFDGPCEIRIGERVQSLGLTLARAIHVKRHDVERHDVKRHG
jgi:DtxR family Mn-dependent transcriptional regulator